MRFIPKTEKEISEANLWQPGIYDFEVLEYTSLGNTRVATIDTTSKNGNEMIVLVCRVYHPNGQFRIIVDYLLESMMFKLRHAAEACGLLDRYEQGELSASDFIGRFGQAQLGIQKDKGGQYPDKNNIVDYIKNSSGIAISKESDLPVLDDEISFD